MLKNGESGNGRNIRMSCCSILFLFNETPKTNLYYHKIFLGIGPGNEDKMLFQRKLETIDLWHAFNRIV